MISESKIKGMKLFPLECSEHEQLTLRCYVFKLVVKSKHLKTRAKMNIQEKSRLEYTHRINKVLDYLDLHIDESLNLSHLSQLACFSPFHFHRIFCYLVGETPNDYIKRKRTEKAARLLISERSMSIGEVAVACGFNSDSVFARTFKSRFDMSANKYREQHSTFSKIDQFDSNNRQKIDSRMKYLRHVNETQKWKSMMTKEFKVKEMSELQVVYCRHTGPFHLIEKAFAKLMAWALQKGLVHEDSRTVTVYHDDPSMTEIEKVRQSACLVLNDVIDIETEGEIGKMTIPGGMYLVGGFEIGPHEFKQAWDSVCAYLTGSGYVPSDGWPYELYYNNHEEHPERKFILDICIPVKPL